jgi:hypothetical protein
MIKILAYGSQYYGTNLKYKSNEWMGNGMCNDSGRICIVSVCAYGSLLRGKVKRLQKERNQMVTVK